jgi:hypothetical protein
MDITQTIATHISRINSTMSNIGRVRPYNPEIAVRSAMTAFSEVGQALTELAAEVHAISGRLEALENPH